MVHTYELELPDAGAVDSLSLKRNYDIPIVINSKDDVSEILGILEDTKTYHKERRNRYAHLYPAVL